MDQTSCVRRHIKQEQRVATDTFIIYLQKVLKRLYLSILALPPEPARTDGHITLRCHPCIAVRRTFIEHLTRVVLLILVDLHSAPACPAGLSLLISYPTTSGTVVAEDDGVRLKFIYCRVVQRPVIDLYFTVRTLTASAVEPLLEHMSVVSQRRLQRLDEYIIILISTVMRIIPVPWRNIDTELKAILTACLRQVLQDIALSVSPRTLRHGMTTDRIWPQAESVVMLCCDDDALHAGSLGDRSPLSTVHLSRVEQFGLLLTASPLCTGEGVGTEMHEHIVFHFLPFHL